MDIQPYMMPDSVVEIPAKGITIAVGAMGVDVVIGNFVKAILSGLRQCHARLNSRDGGLLRAQDNFV